MTRTTFLLTGQGAQGLGMTSDLYERCPIVREIFGRTSNVLGYDIRELIDNEEDRLNRTRYTQPAILTISVAISRLLQKKGYRPDMMAGLSLGEYSVLVTSGALSLEDVVALVTKHDEFVETATPAGIGEMVVVMNTETSLIGEACQETSSKGIMTPANYNTPAQIVIGGKAEAVNYAVELLKEVGVKRLTPLKVLGPFYTVLLQSTSERLAKVFDKMTPPEFQAPLIDNTEAKVMSHADIKALFAEQVKEPVRFCDSIEAACGLGMTKVIEIDPGRVLDGFLRKIDKTIPASTAEDEASLEALLERREETMEVEGENVLTAGSTRGIGLVIVR